jgi:hypothetical protein
MRTLIVGAALGAAAVFLQSMNLPLSDDGLLVLAGRLVGGALMGAFIARVVMARVGGPG